MVLSEQERKAKVKEYYEKNKRQILGRHKKYNEEHKEKIMQYQEEYRKTHRNTEEEK